MNAPDSNVRRYVDGQLVTGQPEKPALSVVDKRLSMQLESTADMRGFLMESMRMVAKGDLDTKQVGAICQLSEQIYKTAKLELDFAEVLKQFDEENGIRLIK